MQHLDLDIYFEQWTPPPQLIDKRALVGAPHHGIGRVAKVGRETVVGLLVALKLFVAEEPGARWAKWLGLMQQLETELSPLRKWGCRVVLLPGDAETSKATPAVRVFLPEAKLELTAMQAVKALQDGAAEGGVQVAPNPPFIEEVRGRPAPMRHGISSHPAKPLHDASSRVLWIASSHASDVS
jgi:hypothetical protein